MISKDEDQAWLDALAGKPNVDGDTEVTQRAKALQQAIRRHDAAYQLSTADIETGLHRLKFRLRRERLTNTDSHSFMNNRFTQFAVAASIMLTIGLTMRVYLQQEPLQNEAEITRGMGERQLVLATDPEQRLKQLTTELDQLGVKYQVNRKEGMIVLNILGVDPAKENVSSFLERNHIKPPVGMSLELDIRQMAKP